jgi:hypothetical protein
MRRKDQKGFGRTVLPFPSNTILQRMRHNIVARLRMEDVHRVPPMSYIDNPLVRVVVVVRDITRSAAVVGAAQ